MSGVRENAGVKFEERSYKGNMLQITNKPRHFGSSLLWRLKKATYRRLLKHPMVKPRFGRLDLTEWSFCNQTVFMRSFYLADDALLYQNSYHFFLLFCLIYRLFRLEARKWLHSFILHDEGSSGTHTKNNRYGKPYSRQRSNQKCDPNKQKTR